MVEFNHKQRTVTIRGSLTLPIDSEAWGEIGVRMAEGMSPMLAVKNLVLSGAKRTITIEEVMALIGGSRTANAVNEVITVGLSEAQAMDLLD